MVALRGLLLGLAGLLAVAAAVWFLAEEAEAAPTYRVFATREGLVGHTTANGHVIKSRDHFVALPTREALSPKGSWEKAVKVCNPANGRCETAPVWDVGPWNIHDDYWNAPEQRDIYSWLDHGGKCCLKQGLPQSQAAYQQGYNGGRDEFGRSVANPAGIDLADGTFWDGLGMTNNGWVDVTFLWLPDPPPPPPSDTKAPETTPTLTGTQGDNGWWRSTVTVKLTATDTGGSGVDHTKYRVDLGAWKTYTGAFALSADGVRRVDYYSVDKAGNQEATKTITIKIDEVPPTTTHALGGVVGLNGWHRSAVTVSLAATDATSGVAATTGTRDGAAFTYGGPFAVGGEGAHSLTYRSQDKAGNLEGVRSAAFKIDTVAPTTVLGRSGPAHQGAHLYVAASTVFSLAASDATSGVAATTRTWRGTAQAYVGPFGLTGPDGLGTLAWRSDDRAGNVEGLRFAEVFLDTTPPALALDAPPEGSVVASLEPVLLTAQASDAGSGLARVEFLVDGVLRHSDSAAPFEWAWPAGDEALGEHVVEVRAVDHLGHVAAVQRKLTTVPTSLAGLEATAVRASGTDPAQAVEALLAEVPEEMPALPVVGVVAEADPAAGEAQVGVLLDGEFLGVQT
jgi:hypothetical protein